jgi:hypothetical protein
MSVDHSSRKHALLSASGASRWINCTPSARMEEKVGREDSSVYAEEGTLAHEIADTSLRFLSFVGKLADKAPLQNRMLELKRHELFQPEMLDYVEEYTTYVLEQWTAARKKTPDAVLLIEERSDFSHVVPDGFGTSDANIVADGLLEIVDLKYGKGVQVDAKNNSQMRLYALGIVRKFSLLYDITRVKMTILQPRLHHIDSEYMTVEDLESWAETVVKPAALRADKGEGICNPGDWCRWCKAKPICRALAEQNMALALKDFAAPKTLEDHELLQVYEMKDRLVDWANAVSKYLLDTAIEGKAWAGLKLVEGRSVRKILDEELALATLKDNGFSLEEITNTKIKGIGDLEKIVGKQPFDALNLTVKPQGAPTLVPEDDKRPAIGVESAKKDFQ